MLNRQKILESVRKITGTKKIFRQWKYIEERKKDGDSGIVPVNHWSKECDGLIKKEMIATGYRCHEDWCVEEDI